MSIEISPADAVDGDLGRERWDGASCLTAYAARSFRSHDRRTVLAVWPAEPIPERYADEMQAIVGRCLMSEVEPCCDYSYAWGGRVMAAWPDIVYCPDCGRDAEHCLPGGDFCDCCLATTDNLRVVFALAGPYLVEAWLCRKCSR